MRTIRPAAYASPLFALLLVACGGDGPATPETPAVLQASPATLVLTEAQPTGSVFLTTNPADRRLDWWVGSKSDWLTVSVDSGTVKGTSILTASVVVPATQDPGPMTGHIEFVYPTGNVTVPVTVTVLPSARVVMTPTSLTFAVGQDTARLTLSNPGHGSVSWNVNPSVAWLTVPVRGGVLHTGESVVADIVLKRASLPAGTTSGAVGVFSGAEAAPTQIPVTVVVPN